MTFGCFNNFTKMGDSVIALWARVLHAVHNSRLFLKSMPYGEPDVVNRTLEGFRSYGIAPDRLILEPRSSSRTSHLAAYSRVDIALDPFPFPGITTSCESLWMGVPVLTKKGDRFVSHQGETIAQNAGLSDWIAQDEDDYVAKALDFTSDLAALTNLRAGLRQKMMSSPLCNAARFARHFEETLSEIWDNWREQT